MDDFILFGPDCATLHCWSKQCREYLAARRLELHPDKYRLYRTAEGVDFCGFVVRADGRVRLRSSGVRRFRKRSCRRAVSGTSLVSRAGSALRGSPVE